jgi:hypothetical protein
MASVVDICNLALSHLGDEATVASIDPPEGSQQAEHCQRFYPIARDMMLEMHDWGFATRRIAAALSATTETISGWQYIYAMPNNALRVFTVLAPDAPDDYSYGSYPMYDPYGVMTTPGTISPAINYQPQPFAQETLSDGTIVIVTNQADAVFRCAVRITDSTKFSPLFTHALTRLLASFLAGPIITGDVGRKEAAGQYQIFMQMLGMAEVSDTKQQYTPVQHSVPWMSGR